jgi:hypothetical protein
VVLEPAVVVLAVVAEELCCTPVLAGAEVEPLAVVEMPAVVLLAVALILSVVLVCAVVLILPVVLVCARPVVNKPP